MTEHLRLAGRQVQGDGIIGGDAQVGGEIERRADAHHDDADGDVDDAHGHGRIAEEAVQRLLELARDAGGDGITMEVVDFNNYSPAVCKAIREFK